MVDSSVGAVILADLSQLDIALTVAETDEPKVKVGQAAQVTLDAVPGVTFAGRVDEMDLVGTMTQGVVNYPATVVMTDTSGQVRPGMNATVSVIVEQRDSVLLVPNRAVQTQGRAHLVTVLYQGQQIQTPVTIGLSGDTQTEVVDGLREGDIVLLNATTATTARGGPGGGFIVRPPGD
jgi:macrolide-specific efflux system membrane fusion protein